MKKFNKYLEDIGNPYEMGEDEEEPEDDRLEEGQFDEKDFQDFLAEIMENDEQGRVDRITTFHDAGVMTRNKGLVVTMGDGTKFQITIVQDFRRY